jgi:hypothetical protein
LTDSSSYALLDVQTAPVELVSAVMSLTRPLTVADLVLLDVQPVQSQIPTHAQIALLVLSSTPAICVPPVIPLARPAQELPPVAAHVLLVNSTPTLNAISALTTALLALMSTLAPLAEKGSPSLRPIFAEDALSLVLNATLKT